MLKAQVALVGPGPDEGGTIIQLHVPAGTKLEEHGAELIAGDWAEFSWTKSAAPVAPADLAAPGNPDE